MIVSSFFIYFRRPFTTTYTTPTSSYRHISTPSLTPTEDEREDRRPCSSFADGVHRACDSCASVSTLGCVEADGGLNVGRPHAPRLTTRDGTGVRCPNWQRLDSGHRGHCACDAGDGARACAKSARVSDRLSCPEHGRDHSLAFRSGAHRASRNNCCPVGPWRPWGIA